MTKTIIITSGRDGVGKTNISVNTALEISRQKLRTCLYLDTDFTQTFSNVLSVPQPENNFDDCIFGNKKLDEVILHSSRGIDIIPGGSGIEKTSNLGKEEISTLISSFSGLKNYDYFIIDGSSAPSGSLISFCLAANETVLIITSEATSLTDAYLLLKTLTINGYKGTVKIVVNKCPNIPISKRTYLRFETVATRRLNIKMALAGIILNDPNIEAAAREQQPLLTLYPNSIASQCIRAMVSTFLEKDTSEKQGTDLNQFWLDSFDSIRADLILTSELPGNDVTESLLRPDNHHYRLPAQVIPFSSSGGIIDPLKLASPISLLSKSLEQQTQGQLSIDELSKIFSSDPALMVRAMQMFSSSRPGGSTRITTISQILKTLGPGVLSSLLTTASMQRALAGQGGSDNLFLNTFWHHSYKCALLAELIAATIDYPYPEEAFIAGLIHDIGRLALQTGYPQVYAQLSQTLPDEESVLETERRIFGLTHAEIGAEAMRAYQFNSFIVDAVRYHIEPESRIKTGFELVKIIFTACQMIRSTQQDSEYLSALGESLFGLSLDQLMVIEKRADEKLARIASHFHIPRLQEMENNDTGETETRLKLRAANYSLLQSSLPGPGAGCELPEIIRQIHQGLDILFGIKNSFLLLADELQSSLQAIGCPNCFGEEILNDIVISLESENSIIIQAFKTVELKISTDEERDVPLSLGDEQIRRFLDSQILVCVPLTTGNIARGGIVFGIKKEELPNIHEQEERLKLFGARSANILFKSEQLLTPHKGV